MLATFVLNIIYLSGIFLQFYLFWIRHSVFPEAGLTIKPQQRWVGVLKVKYCLLLAKNGRGVLQHQLFLWLTKAWRWLMKRRSLFLQENTRKYTIFFLRSRALTGKACVKVVWNLTKNTCCTGWKWISSTNAIEMFFFNSSNTSVKLIS